jgi:exosortase family protein XrtM
MKSEGKGMALFAKNRREIWFLVCFVAFYVIIQAAHYAMRPYTEPFFVVMLHVQAVARIINFITPAEASYVQGKIIWCGNTGLEMVEGCDGIEGFILIAAAICAFPASLKRKVVGIVVGLGVVYLFNLTRIVSLCYLIKYHPDIFDIMHSYVGQTFMVIIGLMVFIIWAVKFADNEKKRA